MFYVICGDNDQKWNVNAVTKLAANAWDDAQKEAAELIKSTELTGQFKIIHVIGECNFDPAEWLKNNPKKLSPNYTDKEIRDMYAELGGEG